MDEPDFDSTNQNATPRTTPQNVTLPRTSFHRYADLPTELQARIWTLAIYDYGPENECWWGAGDASFLSLSCSCDKGDRCMSLGSQSGKRIHMCEFMTGPCPEQAIRFFDRLSVCRLSRQLYLEWWRRRLWWDSYDWDTTVRSWESIEEIKETAIEVLDGCIAELEKGTADLENAKSEPSTTFHRYSSLPEELKINVWNRALLDQAIQEDWGWNAGDIVQFSPSHDSPFRTSPSTNVTLGSRFARPVLCDLTPGTRGYNGLRRFLNIMLTCRLSRQVCFEWWRKQVEMAPVLPPIADIQFYQQTMAGTKERVLEVMDSCISELKENQESVDITDIEPPATFHHYSALPEELKCHVWKLAMRDKAIENDWGWNAGDACQFSLVCEGQHHNFDKCVSFGSRGGQRVYWCYAVMGMWGHDGLTRFLKIASACRLSRQLCFEWWRRQVYQEPDCDEDADWGPAAIACKAAMLKLLDACIAELKENQESVEIKEIGPATSFHLYSALPEELKHHVWRLAMRDESIVNDCGWNDRGWKEDDASFFSLLCQDEQRHFERCVWFGTRGGQPVHWCYAVMGMWGYHGLRRFFNVAAACRLSRQLCFEWWRQLVYVDPDCDEYHDWGPQALACKATMLRMLDDCIAGLKEDPTNAATKGIVYRAAFTRLPVEIQTKIWAFVIRDRRIINTWSWDAGNASRYSLTCVRAHSSGHCVTLATQAGKRIHWCDRVRGEDGYHGLKRFFNILATCRLSRQIGLETWKSWVDEHECWDEETKKHFSLPEVAQARDTLIDVLDTCIAEVRDGSQGVGIRTIEG